MVTVRNVRFSAKTQLCCVVIVVMFAMVMEVATLNGPNVCMVKQKYNITKRVKYRAPMSVRTYEWCMSIPPRCSKWSTEMRDLTRLETEERTAEVAVCCPGYKMKDVSCVPICPNGRTGHGCSQECPLNKWGPNCVNDCEPCSDHGSCSPITGHCSCQEGWQGESCESRFTSITSTTSTTTASVEELLTKKPATKPTLPSSAISSTTTTALVETTLIPSTIKTTTITSSTRRPTTIETTSLRTNFFQETTTTPIKNAVDTISSPKKEAKTENTVLTSKTTLLVNTTVRPNPTTTSPKTRTESTANGTIAIPEVHTSRAVENTTLTPSTKEVFVKMPSMEYGTNKNTASTHILTTPTTESSKKTTIYNNETLVTLKKDLLKPVTQITHEQSLKKTEKTHEIRNLPKEVHVEIKTTPIRIVKTSDVTNSDFSHKTTVVSIFTENPIVTTHVPTTTGETTKPETTRRPDATIRYFPTTVKFKPKEIWIRPAQKGQESFAEAKKLNHDSHLRHRVATNKESAPNTTPKTIIVSIIPTSVSYATFKKIALSTASVASPNTNITLKLYNNSFGQGFTKPMSVLTTLAPLLSTISTSPTSTVANATKSSISKSVNASKPNEYLHKVAKTLTTLLISETALKNQKMHPNGTNSMTTVTQNLNSSNSIAPTVSSTNFTKSTLTQSSTMTKINENTTAHVEKVTQPVIKVVTAKPRNVTGVRNSGTTKTTKIDKEMTNATKPIDIAHAKTNKTTTDSPEDEETFHILTEPEHITAVMEEKGKERTSVDLVSVISIAGGIMMAVITVAVIIVMVERCRRPRYDDVRKMNDIHMQVMIDNNDVPPPYVRSIFHTPLPDPPSSDKCHYQPISTLDRNLKQFMRPVVVQTISPIMLENFRGILECHYDHLPRRSHDFEVRSKHCSIAPSSEDAEERAHLRPCSIAESTIDALKCEAKLDAIDTTTSEPLYAEIPCWRPPSEHAIEVLNYNGEAVTEL